MAELDYRGVLEELGDAVLAADRHNLIVLANRGAERLLGWDRNELVGQPLTVIQPERMRHRHLVAFQRYLDTGEATIMGHPIRVPGKSVV